MEYELVDFTKTASAWLAVRDSELTAPGFDERPAAAGARIARRSIASPHYSTDLGARRGQ
jgi:hypothetical protein